MSTVRELIQDALIEIGVVDPTMAFDASTGAHALRVLNRMLESWSTEDLLVYTENRMVFPLTIGLQDHTIGAGGTINTPRPVYIGRASILLTSQNPAQPPEIPIPILTAQEWQGIAVKNISAQFPTQVWLTGDYPLQHALFWPIPTTQVSVVFYQWARLEAFDSINDTVQFPMGYADAIVYNLAVRLCATYGRTPANSLVALAQNAKSRIRTLNHEPMYIGTDIGGLSRSSMAIRSFGIVVDP